MLSLSRTPVRLLLVALTLLIMKVSAHLPVRLLTHNIRYATTSPFKGEKPWADRKQLLLNELYFNTLYNAEAFICLQEVLHSQLVDIMGGLNGTKGEEGEWDYIGVGRDDGVEKGEYSPILYRKGVWKVVKWKTVWLSETPDVPGKGWDAASVRIVTVGTFQHRNSKTSVVGMCTHFDDQGETSRTESAKLVLRVIDDVTKTNTTDRLPVFLSGDLNSEPSETAYQILNGSNSTLQEVSDLAPLKYGDKNTFTGFQDTETKMLIDHVFVGPRGSSDWTAKAYAVLENKFEDGVYDSDHRAVVGDVVLNI